MLLIPKRAWEEEVDAADGADDDGDGVTAAPSEAFLSLQKELEEKEQIQRENEERARNETALAAEAATTMIRKVHVQMILLSLQVP